MTDSPTPAALSEPMSDERLAEIRAQQNTFMHDWWGAHIRELLAEIDRLRSSPGATPTGGSFVAHLTRESWTTLSRDAALGAALREVVAQFAGRGNVWAVVSPIGVHIEEAGGAVTCNNETAALASQLRAVTAPHSPAAGASETAQQTDLG